jgi:hypothetical protein
MGLAKKIVLSTFVAVLAVAVGFFTVHPYGRAVCSEVRRLMQYHNPVLKLDNIWSPQDIDILMNITRSRPMDSFSSSDAMFGFPPVDEYTCPHKFLALDMCRPPICDPPTKRCVVPQMTKFRGAGVNASWSEVDKLLRSHSQRYMMRLYLIGDPLEGDNVVNDPPAVPLMQNKVLVDAAKRLAPDYTIFVPRLLYVNVVLPGQEVGMHADVPTFRGLNRLMLDTKFMVGTHLSGFFSDYRVKIATAVTYIGNSTGRDPKGGLFSYLPDGPFGRIEEFPAEFNTGVILDTDSVFHRVTVCQPDRPEKHVPPFHPMYTWLSWDPQSKLWLLKENDTLIQTYEDEDLRISLSWKVYMFKDQHEHDLWKNKEEPLEVYTLLEGYRQHYMQEGLMKEDDGAKEFLRLLMVRGIFNWLAHHYRYFDSWFEIFRGGLFGGKFALY